MPKNQYHVKSVAEKRYRGPENPELLGNELPRCKQTGYQPFLFSKRNAASCWELTPKEIKDLDQHSFPDVL